MALGNMLGTKHCASFTRPPGFDVGAIEVVGSRLGHYGSCHLPMIFEDFDVAVCDLFRTLRRGFELDRHVDLTTH